MNKRTKRKQIIFIFNAKTGRFFEGNSFIFHKISSITLRQLCSECAIPGYTKVAQKVLQPKIVLLIIYHAIL